MKRNYSKIRGWVALVFLVTVVVGLVAHTATGTYSAFGFDQIAAICPVGALETLVTGVAPTWHVLVGLVIAIVFGLLFGKAFCSWICPTPWAQRIFGRGTKAKADHASKENSESDASSGSALAPIGGERDGARFDSRHGILLGALLSTAVFGFPVFCLVCPVGLTIATFIAVWHAFQFSEVTWGLVVFPAIVILEVVVFRKWCHTLCPIGALYSLVSRGNKTFVPQVKTDACLRSSGVDCHTCVDACPEKLDPHSGKIPECTKCGVCVERCPAQAIAIKLFAKAGSEESEPAANR